MNKVKLKEAEKDFFELYPKGFADPEMMKIVKKHKPEKMFTLAHELFSRERFDDPAGIVDSMAKIVSRSSMVSVFEKPKFRDFAKSLNVSQKVVLAGGLKEFLFGNQERGFEMMLEILRIGKIAKWTIITVCPVYFYPQEEVFVKPTTAKGIIKHYEIEGLVYKPVPSFSFYKNFREAINIMKKEVSPALSPSNPAFTGFLMMTGLVLRQT